MFIPMCYITGLPVQSLVGVKLPHCSYRYISDDMHTNISITLIRFYTYVCFIIWLTIQLHYLAWLCLHDICILFTMLCSLCNNSYICCMFKHKLGYIYILLMYNYIIALILNLLETHERFAELWSIVQKLRMHRLPYS